MLSLKNIILIHDSDVIFMEVRSSSVAQSTKTVIKMSTLGAYSVNEWYILLLSIFLWVAAHAKTWEHPTSCFAKKLFYSGYSAGEN